MRRARRIAACCLMPLLVCCGQKGGLYLPDANHAPVHKAPVTAAPAATPPDDPTTRRKIPTTPDAASSQ